MDHTQLVVCIGDVRSGGKCIEYGYRAPYHGQCALLIVDLPQRETLVGQGSAHILGYVQLLRVTEHLLEGHDGRIETGSRVPTHAADAAELHKPELLARIGVTDPQALSRAAIPVRPRTVQIPLEIEAPGQIVACLRVAGVIRRVAQDGTQAVDVRPLRPDERGQKDHARRDE